MLVLIQVGLAALARDKHTPETKLDRRNTEKSSADGCEVAAEPLGDPSHFSRRRGRFFIWTQEGQDDPVLPFFV